MCLYRADITPYSTHNHVFFFWLLAFWRQSRLLSNVTTTNHITIVWSCISHLPFRFTYYIDLYGVLRYDLCDISYNYYIIISFSAAMTMYCMILVLLCAISVMITPSWTSFSVPARSPRRRRRRHRRHHRRRLPPRSGLVSGY